MRFLFNLDFYIYNKPWQTQTNVTFDKTIQACVISITQVKTIRDDFIVNGAHLDWSGEVY